MDPVAALIASLQVFQTTSERIESAALAALTTLTSCLSRSVLNSDSEDSLSTFLDLVLKGELRSHHTHYEDLKRKYCDLV